MTIALARKVDLMIEPLRTIADKVGSPLLDLVIRLFMADIFFKSGWLKFANFLDGHWDSTVYLFSDAHPIPGVPPAIAAVMGTGSELGFSILLALGLFTRLGAGGLIIMTCVIQFLVPAEYEVSGMENYYWMLLLAVPFIKGAGPISLDYLLLKWLRKG